MSIETEYRGFMIRYGDNSDEWNCYDIGYSSPKLTLVKARIDKIFLDQRKAEAVNCFEISKYSGAKKIDATIIEYVKSKQERPYNGKQEPVKHIVAVVARRSFNEKASRRETDLADLMPDTPEANAAFDEYKRLDALAKEADQKASDAFKVIPRVTLDMVAGLKRIHDTKNEDAK